MKADSLTEHPVIWNDMLDFWYVRNSVQLSYSMRSMDVYR